MSAAFTIAKCSSSGIIIHINNLDKSIQEEYVARSVVVLKFLLNQKPEKKTGILGPRNLLI